MSSDRWTAISAIIMLFSTWNGLPDRCSWFQRPVIVNQNSCQNFPFIRYSNGLCFAIGDNTAQLWQLRESHFHRVRTFLGHLRSVKTAAFRKFDPTCFATGGRDNAILIWDTRSRMNAEKADNCIHSGHTGGPGTPAANRRRQTRHTPKTPSNVPSNSITGLVFQVSVWADSQVILDTG